jgi:hypothetical protein
VIGRPNVKTSAEWTNVVIHTTWFFVLSRSNIFLPNQTTGKVNNTPPQIMDRFMPLERCAYEAHHKRYKINVKRIILIRISIICLILLSFDLPGFAKPPNR